MVKYAAAPTINRYATAHQPARSPSLTIQLRIIVKKSMPTNNPMQPKNTKGATHMGNVLTNHIILQLRNML